MFGNDRASLRRFFLDVFAKQRAGQALQPLESMVGGVTDMHPEYHALLADPESLHRDRFPGVGDGNPFLHMAMDVAIAEQVAADRPPGIRDAYLKAGARQPDKHALEHAIMECLGRAIWEAQSAGRAPDEAAYLGCVRALASSGGAPR